MRLCSTWWWYKPMKITISLSLSLSRKRVTASQRQPNRGVTRSWAQLVPNHLFSCSTYQTRHPWTCQSSCSRTGSTCSPNLLPGHPISPFSPSLGWHWLEFPQQRSREVGKSGEVSWLQTRPYLIFCRLQLIPWSSNGRLLCRGAEPKPCQGGGIWKVSVVVCNILSFYLPPCFLKRRKVHAKTIFKANCKAKHWQLRPNSGCPSNHTSALLCECPVIHFWTAGTWASFPSSCRG